MKHAEMTRSGCFTGWFHTHTLGYLSEGYLTLEFMKQVCNKSVSVLQNKCFLSKPKLETLVGNQEKYLIKEDTLDTFHAQ